MATASFNTAAKCKRLEQSGEPYWFKIGKGRFIGYRKGKNSGSWVSRLGSKRVTIGSDAQMDYEAALKAVIAWCDREDVGGNRKYLLSECVADYITSLALNRSQQTADDTRERLGKHLDDTLLTTQLSRLTTGALNQWRDGMVSGNDPEAIRKSKNSANRTFAMIKAALNLAFKSGIVDSDQAWRRVSKFSNANAARPLFLTDAQIDRLLENIEGAFHALVKAAVLTGARYGELTAAKVSDFDRIKGVLFLSGKTGDRDCYLSSDGVRLFKELARGKLPEAPLLMSPAGAHWCKGILKSRNTCRLTQIAGDLVAPESKRRIFEPFSRT